MTELTCDASKMLEREQFAQKKMSHGEAQREFAERYPDCPDCIFATLGDNFDDDNFMFNVYVNYWSDPVAVGSTSDVKRVVDHVTGLNHAKTEAEFDVVERRLRDALNRLQKARAIGQFKAMDKSKALAAHDAIKHKLEASVKYLAEH